MHDNITKINFSYIQKLYKEKLITDIPDNILSKVENLKKTYSCFNTHYEPKMIWEKKKFTKKEKHVTKPKNRFHIIIPDFTDNSLNKRQLIGLLNKLTDKNKSVVYSKIKDIIENNNNEETFMVVWSYIKKCENDLYFLVLDFFSKSFLNDITENLWNKYKADREWLPPQYIFENNLLLLNDEYELYCNYVKWKKEINNLNYIWIKMGKDINIILDDLYDFLILYMNKECKEYDEVYKYIIDIFLEQMNKILKHIHNYKFVQKIRQLDIKNFDNSSKFLIYSILEKK